MIKVKLLDGGDALIKRSEILMITAHGSKSKIFVKNIEGYIMSINDVEHVYDLISNEKDMLIAKHAQIVEWIITNWQYKTKRIVSR